jgi:hypothetical protein
MDIIMLGEWHMKKRYFIPLFIVTLITLLFPVFLNSVHAKRAIPQPGMIEKFFSGNKIYRIEIKYLGEQPDKIVEATFYEKDAKKWQKFYPFHPGLTNISDNGSRIVFANWGWYDEGGFKSLTICDGQGIVLKELMFSEILKSKEVHNNLWLRNAAISSNGDYYTMGTDGKDKSQIYLVDAQKLDLLWQRECGYSRLNDLEVSEKGLVMVSTMDYSSRKLRYTIFDNSGVQLWEKSCD